MSDAPWGDQSWTSVPPRTPDDEDEEAEEFGEAADDDASGREEYDDPNESAYALGLVS